MDEYRSIVLETNGVLITIEVPFDTKHLLVRVTEAKPKTTSENKIEV